MKLEDIVLDLLDKLSYSAGVWSVYSEQGWVELDEELSEILTELRTLVNE